MGAVSALFAADTSLVVKTVRFYRADPGQSPGQTQVTAFLGIPADLPKAGGTGEVSLALSIRVLDSVGQPLYEQAWRRRTAVPFPRGEADRLDHIRFTVGAGRFRLEARVVDSVSGREASSTTAVEGFPTPPDASDLMVSPWLRPVATVDTIPQPGEFRRGGLILAIAPQVIVGGATASVAYLLETYAGTEVEGRLTVRVTDESGAVKKQVGPTRLRVAAGIGLLTGQLEVGELAPGRYRLQADMALGEQTVSRSTGFLVDPAVANAPAGLPDDTYFGSLGELGLDQAFAPLAAIAPASELAGWPVQAGEAAKREFLVRFWRVRDPTPRSAGNERRAQFYDGVIYANAFYSDPARGLAGWQTDRGRVFLREGLPIQVLRRQARGTVPGYEVWRYFEPVGRYYLFVDRGTLGSFVLVRSNDPRERREGRWQQWLTPVGVREVVGFLGRQVLAEP
ncbi:MAG: GWxTD domain-containing protein [Gemmatimonadales bacterium]